MRLTASRIYISQVPWTFLQFAYIVCSLLCQLIHAAPSATEKRVDEPAQETPAYNAGVLRDPSFLPAQIGGIVGSYALCLVLVAALLLLLSKTRRERLAAGENEAEFEAHVDKPQAFVIPIYPDIPLSPRSVPRSPVNIYDVPRSPLSFHSVPPLSAEPVDTTPYVYPSPTSTTRSPLGIDLTVDQRIVASDREMAQQQLEEMYKYVMEQEEAKRKGVAPPPIPIPAGPPAAMAPAISRPSTAGAGSTLTKKERVKPAQLNLSENMSEKHQSRTSSIFSVLRSPRKNKMKGVSISSPIMTPMSGTFPRETQEMNTIPPRQYAPAAPPPVPMDQVPYGGSKAGQAMPLTPEYSPDSSMSIDERLGNIPLGHKTGHSRTASGAHTDQDPNSAISENSQAPLVGLPSSPKPSVTRFPSLPSSPKPGATFQRANAPSAVRTGGALPLRAYEPALTSPSISSQQTKQTVFERLAPLSPMGARTPYTGAAVPYSPYQPFSPCVPITPSLVTKADRKRMRRLEPKTPTLEMVKSSDDIW